MAQNPFFIVVAVISALFGLGFVFVPDAIFSAYGVAASDGARLAARFFGSALIGLAIVYAMARELKSSDALRGLLWGGLAINVIDLGLALAATTGSVMNAMGWASVALHAAMLAGFAYLIFGRPAAA
jgi:hypothetical protein